MVNFTGENYLKMKKVINQSKKYTYRIKISKFVKFFLYREKEVKVMFRYGVNVSPFIEIVK